LLSSIVFESDSHLQRIEGLAFSASGLTSIVIPSSVEVLCKCCFAECYSTESITFMNDSKLARIESRAFHRYSAFVRMSEYSLSSFGPSRTARWLHPRNQNRLCFDRAAPLIKSKRMLTRKGGQMKWRWHHAQIPQWHELLVYTLIPLQLQDVSPGQKIFDSQTAMVVSGPIPEISSQVSETSDWKHAQVVNNPKMFQTPVSWNKRSEDWSFLMMPSAIGIGRPIPVPARSSHLDGTTR
jgi:hypothetical protein